MLKNPSYYKEIKQLKHSTNLSFIVGMLLNFEITGNLQLVKSILYQKVFLGLNII